MLRLIRTIGLGAWAVFIGLVIFTTETAADELGWTAVVREYIRSGPAAMLDVSYAGWVTATFWLLTGAVAVAWAEFFLRRRETRRSTERRAQLVFEMKDRKAVCLSKEGTAAAFAIEGQTLGNIYRSDPSISPNAFTVLIVFSADLPDPAPYVFAERKVIWREVKSSERFTVLEIDPLSESDFAFGIIMRPAAWAAGWRNTHPLKWNDASEVPREMVLESGPQISRRGAWISRWLPWLRSGTRPERRPG